jgi:hypothetical protein
MRIEYTDVKAIPAISAYVPGRTWVRDLTIDPPAGADIAATVAAAVGQSPGDIWEVTTPDQPGPALAVWFAATVALVYS